MSNTQQLDIQVNIEDEVLNANLGDNPLKSDFEMGIIAKQYENDYTKLANQPKINGKTLEGDKSAEDLGLVSSSLSTLDLVESPTKSFRESSNIFIDNNGNSLRMTLQQVKEMGSKSVKTSDEMKALLVEDNLGDLVTYIGESGGGELVATPFAVGDTMQEVYLNNPELDLSTLPYDTETGICDILYAPHNEIEGFYVAIRAINLGISSGGQVNAYILQMENYHGALATYSSAPVEALGIAKGWTFAEWISPNELFDLNGAYLIESISYPNIVAQFLSKTPFVASGGYDKDSVYIITKNNDNEIYAKKADTEPELPSVTKEDSGKVLGVSEEGEWVAGNFIPKNTIIDKIVIEGTEFVVTLVDGRVERVAIDYEDTVVATPEALKTSELINDSGFITKKEIPTELPSITSSDEGKFLRVDSNGKWVAESIPSVLGVSF